MKKKGFTLIELLVVISIIALLLAILLPALGAVKSKAQDVMCVTNLKQWSLSYQLYAENNNGKNAFASWGNCAAAGIEVVNHSYTQVLREYYGDLNKMRTCPKAAKPVDVSSPEEGSTYLDLGRTFKAWHIWGHDWIAEDDWGYGSYLENTYIRSPDPDNCSSNRDTPSTDFWGEMYVKNAKNVPMIMDGRWFNLLLQSYGSEVPSVDAGVCGLEGSFLYIDLVVMRRHNKGINVAFLDFSLRNVAVEELWELDWHKSWYQYEEKAKNVDLPRQPGKFNDWDPSKGW